MNKAVNVLFNLTYIEELARKDEWINKVHPVVKLIVTFVYILTVTSVGKYDLTSLLFLGVYPVALIMFGDIPLKPLLQKTILPIVAGASLGIFNPLLDSQSISVLGGYTISAGWISFMALLIKSLLTIFSALLLVATTKVEDISVAMVLLKFPKILALQFLLMFRYINVLVDEVNRVITAYSLRAFGEKKIKLNTWGSLVGQLYLRTAGKAERLYESMKLRGFDRNFELSINQRFRFNDGIYMLFWLIYYGTITAMRIF